MPHNKAILWDQRFQTGVELSSGWTLADLSGSPAAD